MNNLSIQAGRVCSAWWAVVPLILFAATARADRTHCFNIPQGDLATLLTQIALTSGTPIVAPAHLLARHMAGPITGCGSAEAAVLQALSGMNLVVWADRNGGLVVHGPTAGPSAAAVMRLTSEPLAEGDMPSDRIVTPAGICSDHQSSAQVATDAARSCDTNDSGTGTAETGGAATASGLPPPEAE
ncbi:hypothetical protein [Methylorubrum thiocyanatum]|uniref:Secretin/TonB short N-terminal domain-containing protein n=1 Tax=Methylorubrum thiocyanatum TaxID=47958 RepID=A0AA40S636_9HYPH|nr:hypothetical protein [Methylorubrum thiocyanatum]MBA8915230.1 hypothetical protein [Methylorubrum thiocyanatum]